MAPQRPGAAAAPVALARRPVSLIDQDPRARLNAARDQTLTALTVGRSASLLRRIGLAPADTERSPSRPVWSISPISSTPWRNCG